MLPKLLALSKALAEYYQTCHWICKGQNFFQDHLLFERLYTEASAFIDGLAEKAIGTGSPISELFLPAILKEEYNKVSKLNYGKENKEYFNSALLLEQELLAFIKQVEPSQSIGIKNMLSAIADAAEGRIYLLKGRIDSTSVPVSTLS